MSFNPLAGRMACTSLLSLVLTGCFHPPYNNFTKRSPNLTPVVVSAAVGAGVGTAISGVGAGTVIGAAVGTAAGAARGTYKSSEKLIIKELKKQDIQFVRYGSTRILIVPTDRYYVFNTSNLNDICYQGLNNIVNLLRFYPCSKIYVAGFTDNVGGRAHKRLLSQARAETMLTFLWANNIKAQQLEAEGHADRHTIADNHLIHGSALNRRVEIEWVMSPTQPQIAPLSGAMK